MVVCGCGHAWQSDVWVYGACGCGNDLILAVAVATVGLYIVMCERTCTVHMYTCMYLGKPTTPHKFQILR